MNIVPVQHHPVEQIVNVHWGQTIPPDVAVVIYVFPRGSYVNAREDGPRFHTELVYPQPGTPYPGTPVEIQVEDPPPIDPTTGQPYDTFAHAYPDGRYVLNCSTFIGMTINFYTTGLLLEQSTSGESTIFSVPGPSITSSISFGGNNCVAAFTEGGGGWLANGGPTDSLITENNHWFDIDVGAQVKYPTGPPLILNDRIIPGFADTLEFVMRFNGKSIIGAGTFVGLWPVDILLGDPGR